MQWMRFWKHQSARIELLYFCPFLIAWSWFQALFLLNHAFFEEQWHVQQPTNQFKLPWSMARKLCQVLRSLNLSGNLVDEKSATAWSITLGEFPMGCFTGFTAESWVQLFGWWMCYPTFSDTHGSVENHPKGNEYWRYTHFPLNHDFGRKGKDQHTSHHTRIKC